MMNADFNKMLNYQYLIPKFINFQSDYYMTCLKINTETEKNDIRAFVSSVIFNNHGIVIPFQYKLSDEQFKNYEKNKHDVIDTLVWYIFDYNVCRHFVEEYGVFKIIAKVIIEYGAENTTYLFKNKNDEELYRSYAYYILLEYFDNIVYLSNNNDAEATIEDIEKLKKLINKNGNNNAPVIV